MIYQILFITEQLSFSLSHAILFLCFKKLFILKYTLTKKIVNSVIYISHVFPVLALKIAFLRLRSVFFDLLRSFAADRT